MIKRYLWMVYGSSNVRYAGNYGEDYKPLVGWKLFSDMYFSEDEFREIFPTVKARKLSSTVQEFAE